MSQKCHHSEWNETDKWRVYLNIESGKFRNSETHDSVGRHLNNL